MQRNHDEKRTCALTLDSKGTLLQCLDIPGIGIDVITRIYCQGDNGRAVLTLLSVNKKLASYEMGSLIEDIDKTLNLSFETICSKRRSFTGSALQMRRGAYISLLSNYYTATMCGLTYDVSTSLARDTRLPNARTVERILGPDGQSSSRVNSFEWTVRSCLSADGSLSILRAYGAFSSEENRKDLINLILRFREIQDQGGEFHNPRSDAVLELLAGSFYFADLTNVAPFPLCFYSGLDHPVNVPRLTGFHEDVDPVDVDSLNERLRAGYQLSL
jgi:hypothetical protein